MSKQGFQFSCGMALICLLTLMAFTVILSLFFGVNLSLKSEKLFQSEAGHITEAIDKKMDRYMFALQGTHGLFAASQSVERDEFAAYLKHVDIKKNYPGLVHIEFVQRIKKEKKEAFIQDTRASLPQYPHFSIQPDSDQEEFWVVNYVEPELPSEIFGYDVLSSPQRKEAYVRARDTGNPAMTGSLVLRQELQDKNKNSFLIVVPVYKNGSPSETREEKRNALEGFLTAAFRTSELFAEIFRSIKVTDSISVNILFDFEGDTDREIIYKKTPAKLWSSRGSADFNQINSIHVGGRSWDVHFRAPADFGVTTIERRIPYYVFIAGMLISILVAGVVFLLLSSRAQAVDMAKKMTVDLRQSERYNRNLFEQSPVGLALCWMDGTLVDVNAAYAKILGRSPEEALQLTPWQITPEKYKQQEADLLDSLRRTGRYGPYEKEYIHRDGHLVPVRLNGTLIKRDGVSFIWASVEDVSVRRNLEEQLLQSQKMDALGQLAGGVAHDFNNLLTVIGGYSELLLNKLAADDSNHQKVQQIKMAADQAGQLTKQLLAFSRRETAVSEILCLNQVIQKMNGMTNRLIGENIEIEVSLADDLANVKIDPSQFEQVILNLAVNARDAMPKGGKIKIETKNIRIDQGNELNLIGINAGDYVSLTVSDTGGGMTQAVQSRIFEPFYTTKDKGKGSGLGLSTVYGIITQYRGKILVDSQVGVGTTFKIYLPRENTEPSPISSVSKNKPQDLVGGKETLLVVEDDVDVRDFSVGILKDLGYRVWVAGNGEEALKVIEKNGFENFDLIITDVILPRMGGKALADHLRKKAPAIKILFVSGYPDREIEKDGILKDGVIFLPKPFSTRDLSLIVRKVLDS